MFSLLLSLASSDAQACSPALSEEVRSFPEWGAQGIGVDSRILLQVGVDRLQDPDGLDLDVRDAEGELIAGQVEVIFSTGTQPSLVSFSFVAENELPANSEIRATVIGVSEGDELVPASVLFETGAAQARRNIARRSSTAASARHSASRRRARLRAPAPPAEVAPPSPDDSTAATARAADRATMVKLDPDAPSAVSTLRKQSFVLSSSSTDRGSTASSSVICSANSCA